MGATGISLIGRVVNELFIDRICNENDHDCLVAKEGNCYDTSKLHVVGDVRVVRDPERAERHTEDYHHLEAPEVVVNVGGTIVSHQSNQGHH